MEIKIGYIIRTTFIIIMFNAIELCINIKYICFILLFYNNKILMESGGDVID